VLKHHFFDKRLMYEESIRVPLLIRYPRMIKQGTTNSEMVLNVDVAPTILTLAGATIPETMDGMNFKPLLEEKKIEWREDFLYEYYEYPGAHSIRKNRGIRTKRWKYIHFFEEPQEFELYDLQYDPNEIRNLIDEPVYKNVVVHLKNRMNTLRRELKDRDL